MPSETLTAEPFLSGLFFGECPRWHEGRLWYSDFFDHAVFSVSPQGERRTEVAFDGEPAGLGWLPDGRLLIASRLDRRIVRREPDGSLVPHGDLTPWATWHANDMVVASNGQAYAGNFGFDLDGIYDGTVDASVVGPASLVRVDPDGSSCEAAADIAFPNGTVITEDGRTLIIAESAAAKLTAFDRADGRHARQPPGVGGARERRPRRHLPVRGRHHLGVQCLRAGVRPRRRGRRGPPTGRHEHQLLRLHAGRRRSPNAVHDHRTGQPCVRRPGRAQGRHREGAHRRAGRRPALRSGPQPSLVSAPRRLRTAWPMRCSFSMRAKRTWPSPPGPNPTPGEVATSASLTRYFENSSDPISR